MTIAPAHDADPQDADPQDGGPEGDGTAVGNASGQRVVRAAMRRRRARQRRRRATILQSVLTVVFVVALIVLGLVGWRSSLKLTGGRDLEITDAAAPGYVAEVKPTPADLIAVTDAEGGLATMLLVLGDAESPTTTIVPISAWVTLWEFEDADPASARNLFAEGGIDVLQLRLGADLTFGATASVTVPAAQIEQLATAVGPMTVDLPDNVLLDDGAGGSVLKYAAGSLTLQPTEVMEFLSVQGQGEAELNRSLRLGQAWSALLGGTSGTATATATDGDDADDGSDAAEDESVFAGLVARLGDTAVSVQLLPTNEIPLIIVPPISIDQIDTAAMSAWVPKYVPFPTSAYPGQRATVNLLNGTSSGDAIKAVAPKVVAGGGEISLTGNAGSFDVATSTVQYSDASAKAAADAIAAQLGLTATAARGPIERVDVTVVVGKDLVP